MRFSLPVVIQMTSGDEKRDISGLVAGEVHIWSHFLDYKRVLANVVIRSQVDL